MSVNTELQALLTKMGGTPLESDSNSDLIKKISNAYESGGSSAGVEIYYLTLECTSGSYTFSCAVSIYDNETMYDAITTIDTITRKVIGIPKFANGPIVLSLRNSFDNVNTEVLPQVTGSGELDSGYLVMNGDCTFIAAGTGLGPAA